MVESEAVIMEECNKYEGYYREKVEMLKQIGETSRALIDTEEFQTYIDCWGFNFLRSGVLVVRVRDGVREYLCTEETKMKIGNDYQDVFGIWNLPSGSCASPTEKRQDAGIREVLEETGYQVKIIGFLFTTSKADPYFPYSMNVYVAKLVNDEPLQDFDRTEVRSIRWMTAEQIEQLGQQQKLRSPHFILGAVRRYEQGLVLSLDYAADR